MRALIIVLVVMLTGSINPDLKAQKAEPVPGSWMDHVGVGGNLGLRFGDVTYVEISPIAGYRLGPFLMPGIGGSYRFYKDRYSTQGISLWGASAWVRAYPLPMVFAYAEHEELYGAFDYNFPNQKYFIGTNFVGGGYSQEVGNASTYVMVLFALNQDFYGIYQNPVIRVGFMIGGNAE
jgi:hypothetical protein